MDDTFPADVAPLWAWGVTGGSAVLALLSHLLGGSAIELFTGVAVAVTLVGGVYIAGASVESSRRTRTTRVRRPNESGNAR